MAYLLINNEKHRVVCQIRNTTLQGKRFSKHLVYTLYVLCL